MSQGCLMELRHVSERIKEFFYFNYNLMFFQFSYFLASYSKFQFASFGIVSGVPFIGFGALPKYNAPIIDLHGTEVN